MELPADNPLDFAAELALIGKLSSDGVVKSITDVWSGGR
jgi:hypothetical protein